MRKIMNHFTRLSKCLEDDNHDVGVEFRMLYSLSVLAELIRENPKVYFPFTRKFLSNIFLIDEQCLNASPHKRNILAILGVLYENLSRQLKLLEKYSMVDTLKNAILGTYSLIDELFTLKVYNKSIMNLVQKGVIFSSEEFQKNQILDTVSLFISKSQVDIFLLQTKLAALGVGKVMNNETHNECIKIESETTKSTHELGNGFGNHRSAFATFMVAE